MVRQDAPYNFLVDNVRIHLDDVESLGAFLEFEAVLGEDVDDARGHAQVASLAERFGIRRGDLVADSYGDLIADDPENG